MLDLKEKFFNFLKRFDPFFHQVNDFYSAYHVLVKMALVGAIVMSAIKYVEDQRSFSIDREIFDLNDVPCGKVVWIYPKDKSKSAVMPDSLKKELNVQENKLNYNVDVWEVGVLNGYNQVVKMDVPDYAIKFFKLNELVNCDLK